MLLHADGLRDTHFARPDGLDTPGHVSSARDVAVLAQVAMHSRVVRELVRLRSETIEGGSFVVRTWNDLLGVFPGLLGVLGQRHRASADLIAIRCAPEAYEREAVAAGYRRRAFDYPIGWYLDPRGALGAEPVLMPPAATELV